MKTTQTLAPEFRRRLMAGASSMTLLAAGLIAVPGAAHAQALVDLATTGTTLQGAAAGDLTGAAVSGAGDINDDGFDDLIIGARNADPNGISNAGTSYVVFGSAQGFPATIDLASEADIVIHGAGAGDISGDRVSGAGDLNDDGIDDLIIGAPRADPLGRGNAGAAYVIFGDQSLPSTIDLASEADVVIQGAVAGDAFGSSVSAAGDINGDGIDDLIIGAYLANSNDRGAAYVVFGSDQGLPAVIDLASGADLVMNATALGRAGRSVSGAGDVNGDGIDDVIVGAPFAAVSGRGPTGKSYVVFGSQALPAVITLETEADVVIHGAASSDRAGFSVSGAGDLNGDGVDDLIIGADGANNSRGASYVVLGGQGLPAVIDLASEADVVISGAATGDLAGKSVSGAGDVNDDGLDDVIVGAQQADPGGLGDAGASYVIFGSDQGLPAAINLPAGADRVIKGAFAGDLAGSSVSGAGDVDGDGVDDLIVGASGADPNALVDAGAAHVVLGSSPKTELEDLIALVEAAGLQNGIENALTKKLENALKDLAKGNTNGASGKIGAFINQVEAQSGKKIDPGDADTWIAAAQAILDSLA